MALRHRLWSVRFVFFYFTAAHVEYQRETFQGLARRKPGGSNQIQSAFIRGSMDFVEVYATTGHKNMGRR
jgi:hypothetical protein